MGLDPFDLKRFETAQAPVYQRVIDELARGCKSSHWMWFIFPQLQGLGFSAMSMRYGISGLAEAQAYLAHPVLGRRLRECTHLVLQAPERSALEIFGFPDDMKFRSSMTLFAQAAPPEPIFQQALEQFYGGEPDPQTLAGIRAAAHRR
jgi:uncharacterized protein (DUF1810 family)